ASLENGAPGVAVSPWRDGIPLEILSELWRHIVTHHKPQKLTIEAEDEPAFGCTKADRVFDQRLEDRLQIERGASDHLEELARGRLLLEGDPQLAVPRLQCGEEADVLDGDDGLIGKGRHQLDLLVAEGRHFASPQSQGADRLAIAQHRDR